MAVWEVCAAWGAVLSDAWLPRTLRHVMEEGIEEEAIERHCQQLLQMILAGYFDKMGRGQRLNGEIMSDSVLDLGKVLNK